MELVPRLLLPDRMYGFVMSVKALKADLEPVTLACSEKRLDPGRLFGVIKTGAFDVTLGSPTFF